MQKKNKKGFTLIELLAVIVILAIIALIAVPVIMNVITKARISAFEDSAYGIVKAGEMYYTNKLLDAEGMTKNEEFTVVGDVFKNTEDPNEILDLSGSMPKSGKVTVTSDGKVALAISNGEYCIRKATTESSVKAEKLSDLGGVCNYKTVFTKASDGTEVPACITNNTECPAGTKVGVQVNASKKYDFYVMEDNTEDNAITLLMSENLGERVAWVSKDDYVAAGGTESDYGNYGNNNKGPLTALKALEERTSNWTNIPAKTYQVADENNNYSPITRTNVRARLITATEAITLLLLSDNSWVYPRYDLSYSYWTSSGGAAADIHTARVVTAECCIVVGYEENGDGIYDGYTWLIYAPKVYFDDYGIRPVITISKTVL